VTMPNYYFVSAPKGIEGLLLSELQVLGLNDACEARGGVSFRGSLEEAYSVCMWSRLANRVLFRLSEFPCESAQQLYSGISEIDWAEHMQADASMAVDFNGNCSGIRNSHFGALKVKDAIVDQFRRNSGQRPDISKVQPDLRVNVFLHKEVAQVYVDFSGDSLHRRGYRQTNSQAPLKENLAAAILSRGGWAEVAAQDGEFLDPMCGSATLLIEAAMIAGDIAPGILRDYYGFFGWKGHQPAVWQAICQSANERKAAGKSRIPVITGYDIDHRAINIAQRNILKAGLEEIIHIERRPVVDARPGNSQSKFGFIAVNPPYGERMSEKHELYSLYTEFGTVLKTHFPGWQVAMLILDSELGFRLGIRSRRPYTLYNGAMECKLLNLNVIEDQFFRPKEITHQYDDTSPGMNDLIVRAKQNSPMESGEAVMFANRLKKNLRNIGKWAQRQSISCFRVYDADLPEYALAVDIYAGESKYVHIQEYQAPNTIDPQKAEDRLVSALAVIPVTLGVSWEQIVLKIRRKQKGNQQYEKQSDSGRFHQVTEGGNRFLVNFEDYLDTGLFLDHRMTRGIIQDSAKGKKFLNLFGYTGTATVCAAAGGALSTTTIDLSKTYLDWARRNFVANELNFDTNELIQANVMDWLAGAGNIWALRYGLIFLDPPTFSNSKKFSTSFDVQRDHVELIKATVKFLEEDGQLIFSTNSRRFKLDVAQLDGLNITEITKKTIPKDFERNSKIHYCWIITY